MATRFLLEYRELGGTRRGIEQSFRMMNPEYGMKDRMEGFKEWMTPADEQTWEQAKRYYRETLLGGDEDPKVLLEGTTKKLVEPVLPKPKS